MSQKNYPIVTTFKLLKRSKIEFKLNWELHKINYFLINKRNIETNN